MFLETFRFLADQYNLFVVFIDKKGEHTYLSRSLSNELMLNRQTPLSLVNELKKKIDILQSNNDLYLETLGKMVSCLTLRVERKSLDFIWVLLDHQRPLPEVEGGNIVDIQAQRLETLGLVSGGVAHDFNNLLTGILGHITYLKAILPQKGSHEKSLKAIESGARQSSLLIQQILGFVKVEKDEADKHVDLAKATIETCSLLSKAMPVGTDLIFDSHAIAPVEVNIVKNRLIQILINLIINAKDALNNEKGVVSVKVGTFPNDDVTVLEEEVTLGTFKKNTLYGFVSVSDTGSGIKEEYLEKIFEPFFTTKKEKGTGIGLATVAAVVKTFNGFLTVHSSPQSTCFTTFFPLSTQRSAQQQDFRQGRKDQKQKERNKKDEKENSVSQKSDEARRSKPVVLVVDDETSVREVVTLSLEHLGYTPIAFSNPRDALKKFALTPQAFDIIMTDMVMPELSGEELFFELRKFRTDIPVIVISGFTAKKSLDLVLQQPHTYYLAKPFTVEVLSETLNLISQKMRASL